MNATNAQSMKWHGFLIYFALWGAAAAFAFSALDTLCFRDMPSETGGAAEGAYIVFGVIYGLCAVYAVVTRFALARLKRRGPVMLYTVFALNSLLPRALSLTEALSAGKKPDLYGIVAAVAVLAAVIALNAVYYRRRARLFAG